MVVPALFLPSPCAAISSARCIGMAEQLFSGNAYIHVPSHITHAHTSSDRQTPHIMCLLLANNSKLTRSRLKLLQCDAEPFSYWNYEHAFVLQRMTILHK